MLYVGMCPCVLCCDFQWIYLDWLIKKKVTQSIACIWSLGLLSKSKPGCDFFRLDCVCLCVFAVEFTSNPSCFCCVFWNLLPIYLDLIVYSSWVLLTIRPKACATSTWPQFKEVKVLTHLEKSSKTWTVNSDQVSLSGKKDSQEFLIIYLWHLWGSVSQSLLFF